MFELQPLPAFQDNYIWALRDPQGQSLVVDPGEAAPVKRWLSESGSSLQAILVTHHHPDHVGGINELLQDWPEATVYGPADESIPGRQHALRHGDRISLPAPALSLDVIAVPGHTLGHIAFFTDDPDTPILFCGDTLFSAGCGRLFEGTPEQMLQSLDRLAALPDSTRVCCAHEYTEANLRFCRSVLPDDDALLRREQEVRALRAKGKPSLPVSLAEEKHSNLFLRVDEPAVATALAAHNPQSDDSRSARFATLRRWKDTFRG